MGYRQCRMQAGSAFLATTMPLTLALALYGCSEPAGGPAEDAAERPTVAQVNAQLVAHDAEFQRTVYTVADGVYQAVGFGLANSIMVEGDDCVFIVDVMATREAAQEVRAAFAEITDKPIAALIYTHNHCLLYTSPSPRDVEESRMPSSA